MVVMLDGYGVYLWGNENVLELTMMVQPCERSSKLWIYCYANYISMKSRGKGEGIIWGCLLVACGVEVGNPLTQFPIWLLISSLNPTALGVVAGEALISATPWSPLSQAWSRVQSLPASKAATEAAAGSQSLRGPNIKMHPVWTLTGSAGHLHGSLQCPGCTGNAHRPSTPWNYVRTFFYLLSFQKEGK